MRLDRRSTAISRTMDVRLTQGGEPTFVSIDDMNGPEWNYTPLSAKKLKLAEELLLRLKARFAPQGLLHYGQGKWYPGEPVPRWAIGVHWRHDGEPLWRDATRLADVSKPGSTRFETAMRFMSRLAGTLGLPERMVITAYEDVPKLLQAEAQLPVNVDPLKADLSKPDERARIARLLLEGPERPLGLVLPLRAAKPAEGEATPNPVSVWESSPWPLKRERLYAVQGDSPLGMRLPLSSLPDVLPEELDPEAAIDPFAPRAAMPERAALGGHRGVARDAKPREVVKTALVVQVRNGHLHVFMPPVPRIGPYLALLAAVEATVAELDTSVVIEGYPPPRDPRLSVLNVTPDPGVIEVNVQPSASWRGLVELTETLYEEARQSRLGAEKFMVDGRHTGTGGGNHITLGGATPADSPLLRRPDLLRSLVTYWQNHPSLSYLFSGTFIGPTSQAPRVDEARDDRLYELNIAFQQLAQKHHAGDETPKPWLVDRLLRHLLTDLTGNTHRAEFSIDKLYSPDTPTGRLGLLEFRAFEMPPHPHMSLAQMLLLRALVSSFWQQPYRGELVPWGTALHDRWLLPHFVEADFRNVIEELRRFGYPFAHEWYAPFVEFRFPRFRQRELRRCLARVEAGDRALARAGRGSERNRRCALCRLVARAPAGQGGGGDARSPSHRVQSPRVAAVADGHARRVRRRRALSRLESAVGAASHHPRASAADLRHRRRLVGAVAGRLHLPRHTSGRSQLRYVSGQRERSRGAPRRALPPAGTHAGPDGTATGTTQPGDARHARLALAACGVGRRRGWATPPRSLRYNFPLLRERLATVAEIRTRFAPSPTGYLHLGSARTALFAWAFARHYRGQFILRIEDTDVARSTAEAVKAIFDSMTWLGLGYDEGPYFQMQRIERYRAMLASMVAKGTAYLCYTTPAELDALRAEQTARGEKPRYDGRWRPENAVGKTPPVGVDPVVRFKNPLTGSVIWDDQVKGRIEIANAELDDLVIARSDGTPTYNFCVVVDDIDMRITHVVRGDDHVNNTPRQINLMHALGAEPPVYAHLPTVLGADGHKLSKRHGAVGVMDYAADGYLPEAMLNFLARLGWAHGDDEIFTREQLIEWFDVKDINPAPARFDEAKLKWVNHEHIKRLPAETLGALLVPFLRAHGLEPSAGPAPSAVADLLRDRGETLKAMAEQAVYFYTEVEPDPALVRQHLTPSTRSAIDILVEESDVTPWNRFEILARIKAIAARSGLKPPQLMMALRVLVAGTTHTPAIDAVLAVLGRDKTLARLERGLMLVPDDAAR